MLCSVWHIDVGSSERVLQASVMCLCVAVCEPSFYLVHGSQTVSKCASSLCSGCVCVIVASNLKCLSPILFPDVWVIMQAQNKFSSSQRAPEAQWISSHFNCISSLLLYTFKQELERNRVRMRLSVDCCESLCVSQIVITSIFLKYRQVFLLSSQCIANYHPLERSCTFLSVL